MSDASWLAWCFHNAYEELAPDFGYETRPESRVPFFRLPEANRNLMIATCQKLLDEGVIAITFIDHEESELRDYPPIGPEGDVTC